MQEKKFRIDAHQNDLVVSSSITRQSESYDQTVDAELKEEEEHLVMVIPPQQGRARTRTRTRARSQPDLRRVAPRIPPQAVTTIQVERRLPNGDLYTGSVFGNAPHGAGKYLWSDGCMYEGEWQRGKATGKGRFSWPSGATYEGEFKAGRMDGYGTFTGTDGDTYRGTWSADKKHGRGEKCYANGDYYEGSWKKNLQDGEGKYVWSNGSVYAGDWRNGMISGKGVLIWVNGNRYEGYWENGAPKGEGIFTRGVDGSTYTGNWGNEMAENGDVGLVGAGEKKMASIDGGGRYSMTERGVNFPRICIWEDDEEGGDITCDIIDTMEVSKLCRPNSFNDSLQIGIDRKRLVLGDKSPKNCQSPSQSSSPKPYWFGGGSDNVRKPGQAISKGHKNYDLLLTLQLGIRHSVGKYASKWRELKQSDFEPKEKYWTRFPAEGSKSTPPHQSVDFKWKDYFPVVFRQLRELFGIDPVDYMMAICESDSLREFSSPGKSGSSFYLTQDDRFMIKTVKKSEGKVLIRMLPSYYRHVFKYKNTLITKFFGLHCIKPIGGQKIRFVVMGNLFHSDYRIHKRFDLKGSSYGRSIDKPKGEIDETTTLKDLDLNFIFRLQHSWFQDLLRQVDRDCEFLEAEKIMDYSLLIGLHIRDDFPADIDMSSPGRSSSRNPELVDPVPPDTEWMVEGRPFIRLGANMPARAERVIRIEIDQQGWSVRSGGSGTPRNGETTSPQNSGTPRIRIIGDGTGEVFNVILYFGIIDILQDYDISKRIEHAYKSFQVDSTSISAVDPKFYSKRFRDFIHKIFVEDKEE